MVLLEFESSFPQPILALLSHKVEISQDPFLFFWERALYFQLWKSENSGITQRKFCQNKIDPVWNFRPVAPGRQTSVDMVTFMRRLGKQGHTLPKCRFLLETLRRVMINSNNNNNCYYLCLLKVFSVPALWLELHMQWVLSVGFLQLEIHLPKGQIIKCLSWGVD